MDLIVPHNFPPCKSMFTASGSGNETCIPELTLTQAGPEAHSSALTHTAVPAASVRRILRTKTEAHKTSPLPPLRLQLWGSQHEQGIYEYEYTRIYIDSMADHWQVFLVALAVELFRKSLLALRYLRETLQKKSLAFTFWLESRRALNCWYQAWWFQTLKESLESMQYKVDWPFVLDCSS